jgi:hypothetical protein
VELSDDIRASADLPVVTPKHEMTLDGNSPTVVGGRK